MLKSILRSVFRRFKRNPGISTINLLGLSLSFTAFLFIIYYFLYEQSFDRFFNDSERIYRITQVATKNGTKTYDGTQIPRGLYFVKEQFPEIEACGYSIREMCQVKHEEEAFFEQPVLWVDKGFEEVFGFDMIKGDISFDKPLTGIISESKARSLFGDSEPIGKIIEVNEGMPIAITGVFSDLPSNTHLDKDYFISVRTWIHYGWIEPSESWGWNAWRFYVKLREGALPEQLETRLARWVDEMQPHLKQENRTIKLSLQPLKDIHFDNSKADDIGKKTSKNTLFILAVFGLLLLVVAWINYINLSTAQTMKNKNIINIQNFLGAGYGYHVLLVLAENLFAVVLATTVAWALYFITFNAFEGFLGLSLSNPFLPTGLFAAVFVLVLFTGTLLSTAYASATVLKIKPSVTKQKHKESIAYRGMVIAQLAISILFISLSILIYKQIHFVQEHDLGASLDQVVVLSGPTSYNGEEAYWEIDHNKINQFRVFSEHLLQDPNIHSTTAMSALFGSPDTWSNTRYACPEKGPEWHEGLRSLFVDNGFVETFGLRLLAGTPFPKDKNSYHRKAMINQKAMKALGFDSPGECIGKTIQRDGRTLAICAVAADFHFEGLHKEIYPLVMELEHPSEFGYYPIKIASANSNHTLKQIEKAWNKFYPNDPYYVFFMDTYFNEQYQAYVRVSKLNILFTLLTVFISCLGLFGMVAFYLERKRKEIGIRKVSGARTIQVMSLLIGNFATWLLIAFVVSVPLSFLLMNRWLQNFAYRTNISWWIFASAGIVVSLTALLTVSWQTWRAANRNPVEALRSE